MKEIFEKNNFQYIPNITDKKDPSLEIDGIAIKQSKCYVVECKGWRLGKFVDEKQNRDQIIRDLKGIVIGEKYTTKNQSLMIEKKPSLKKKVDYIKNNQQKFIYNNSPIEIIGLIVTIGYPPIREFNGIKMISIEEIENLTELSYKYCWCVYKVLI